MNVPRIFSVGLALIIGCSYLFAATGGDSEPKKRSDHIDREFLEAESAAADVVIAFAGEAASRAERAAVRAYARVLVLDYEKASEALVALANSKGIEIESADMDSRISTHNEIGKMEGTSFDLEFVALMMQMHSRSLKNHEETANRSSDPDMKKWAVAMLPGLRVHLNSASLLSSLKSTGNRKPNTIEL